MNNWLVFDIGCIECGQSSRVVGIYASEEEANKVAQEYATKDIKENTWGRKEWHGQHSIEVFDLSKIEEN